MLHFLALAKHSQVHKQVLYHNVNIFLVSLIITKFMQFISQHWLVSMQSQQLTHFNKKTTTSVIMKIFIFAHGLQTQ